MRSPHNGCLGLIVFAVLVVACVASGRSWWICALIIFGSYLLAAIAVWAIYAWREACLAPPTPPPRPAHLGAQLYEPDRPLGAPCHADPTDSRVF